MKKINFKNIINLFLFELRLNKKRNMIYILGIFLIFIIDILSSISGTEQSSVELSDFSLLFSVSFIYVASASFYYFENKSYIVHFMSLPTTREEKILYRFLYSLVFYPIAFFSSILVLQLLSKAILSFSDIEVHISLLHLFTIDNILSLCYIHSILFLGSTIFKTKVLLKTSIFVALTYLFMLLLIFIFTYNFVDLVTYIDSSNDIYIKPILSLMFWYIGIYNMKRLNI